MKSTLDEENLAATISSDPVLIKNFFQQLKESTFTIPASYEREINDIMGIQVSLITSINGADDYKTLVEARNLLLSTRGRLCTIINHLEGQLFCWSRVQRKATRISKGSITPPLTK